MKIELNSIGLALGGINPNGDGCHKHHMCAIILSKQSINNNCTYIQVLECGIHKCVKFKLFSVFYPKYVGNAEK